MPVVLRNNATTTLASSITALSTSIALKTGDGGKFPAPGAGEWFPVTLVKADNSNEIVRCTARTGDVLTVARAQEGTLAQVFSAGDRVELRVTAAVLAEQKADTTAAQEAADAARAAAETAQTAADLGVKKDAATTTGAAILPAGTVAQRPASPSAGMLRHNTESGEAERYQGGKWLPFNVMDKALNEAPLVTIASAGTINIGAAAANTINISGTVAITSLGTVAAGAKRTLVFQGILTLTHNATSLILPNNKNIKTAAGDAAEFVSLGGGNWKCIGYTANDIDFTIIYPNGGSEGSPANVAVNSRYASANPFPEHHVVCQAEVQVSGIWGTTGWVSFDANGTVTGSQGVKSAQHGAGIITQVGNNAVAPVSAWGGGSLGLGASIAVPTPCRVKVWKVKGAIA